MLNKKNLKLIRKYYKKILFWLTVGIWINNKIVENSEYNYLNIEV